MPEDASNKTILYITIAVIVIAFGASAFFLTQDIEQLRDTIQNVLTRAQESKWSFPIVCGLYLMSAGVMFPIIILNLATAIVFGPIYGFLYALAGTMLASSTFFGIGRIGRGRGLEKILSRGKIAILDRRFSESGVLGVAVLRLVPIAPFGIFNMAAGVTSVSFIDYFAGTFIAFWPGGMARSAVGQSLVELVLDPSPKSFIYLACGIILWILIVAGLHFGLKKYRTRFA